jgi:hypothetical protein
MDEIMMAVVASVVDAGVVVSVLVAAMESFFQRLLRIDHLSHDSW